MGSKAILIIGGGRRVGITKKGPAWVNKRVRIKRDGRWLEKKRTGWESHEIRSTLCQWSLATILVSMFYLPGILKLFCDSKGGNDKLPSSSPFLKAKDREK